jgi:hypothetical protein
VAGAIVVHANVFEARLLVDNPGDNLGVCAVLPSGHLDVWPEYGEAEVVVGCVRESTVIDRAGLAQKLGGNPADNSIWRAEIPPTVPVRIDDLIADRRQADIRAKTLNQDVCRRARLPA